MNIARVLAASAVSALAVVASVASTPLTGGDPSAALEACAGDEDIGDNTVIAIELKDSVHELVQCGQIQFQLLAAIVNSFRVVAGDPSGAPDDFAFQDGAYKTTGTGVAMDVTFVGGDDTPGFAKDDPIGADFFEPDNYLVGADATRDGAEVTITFTDTGPLAALLGKGDAPTSPMVLTDDDLAAISLTLAGLQSDTIIRLDDTRAKSHFTYNIAVPRGDVGSLLTAQSTANNIESLDGGRDDLKQVITTPTWELVYQNVTQGLAGTIKADVKEGPFDYSVTYTYDGTPNEPVLVYSCL